MSAPDPTAATTRLEPRLRLLAALVRRPRVHPGPRRDDLARLADPGFRDAFFAFARRHRVLGTVLVELERLAATRALPDDITRPTGSILERLRRQAVVWNMERDRMLALLAREGLQPVVLKGGALRETLYREEPAVRSLADIDVLLPPDEVDPALRRLTAAGYRAPPRDVIEAYRRNHFHVTLTRDGGIQVELHWRLTREDAAFQLDPAAFLRRAVVIRRTGGPPLRSPAPEDMLLHIASQNIESAYSLLFRLVDVDRLLASGIAFDWDDIERAARAGGLEVVLGLTLDLSRAILGTRVPVAARDRFDPGRLTRFHLRLARPVETVLTRRTRGRPAVTRYVRFWSIPDWRGRAAYLARMIARTSAARRAGAEGAEPPARPLRAVRGIGTVVQLLGHHVRLYATARRARPAARRSSGGRGG